MNTLFLTIFYPRLLLDLSYCHLILLLKLYGVLNTPTSIVVYALRSIITDSKLLAFIRIIENKLELF